MNSPRLHEKVTSDKGLAAQLALSEKSAAEIADELYLRTYSRPPTPEEIAVVVELFAEARDAAARRSTTEDLLWALINTPEFLLKD